MIVTEITNDVSTVRIHDEFCEDNSDQLISSVSRTISEFYKRKYMLESVSSVNVGDFKTAL